MKRNWNLRGAVDDLLGRRQRQLAAELRGQIDACREAVTVTHAAATGTLDSATARERVGDLEDTGDLHRAELIHVLSTTFVIPIDREDLFRFSRSVDDVLDNLRDFCRELDLYGPATPSERFVPLLAPLGEGIDALAAAVDAMIDDPAEMAACCLQAKKAHNRVRAAYQHAIAALFDAAVDATALKRRELLRRLDIVSLRMGEAADTLADGHLKRGG